VARPNKILSLETVLSAYDEAGSMRGAARALNVPRSVVQRHLRSAGVEIRDQQGAMDAVRLRRISDQ
jgi:transposase-like protein